MVAGDVKIATNCMRPICLPTCLVLWSQMSLEMSWSNSHANSETQLWMERVRQSSKRWRMNSRGLVDLPRPKRTRALTRTPWKNSSTTAHSNSIRSYWKWGETSSSWWQVATWWAWAPSENIAKSSSPPKSCPIPYKKRTKCFWNDY